MITFLCSLSKIYLAIYVQMVGPVSQTDQEGVGSRDDREKTPEKLI